MSRSPHLVLLLSALTVVAWTPLASSQVAVSAESEIDPDDFDDAARVLFEVGTREFEAGNFAEALPRYENAYDLSQRALLLYNIAVCHDRLDHKEEAATYYERFVAELPDSGRADGARSRAGVLRASLAEDEVAAQQLAEERAAREQAEREQAEQAAQAEGARREREAESQRSRSYIGPIAAFAVAGAGLVTFGVAGGIALGRYSDLKTDCEDRICDEADADAVDRVALIADIGLGVAIAGAAVGVILLVVGGGGDDEGDEAAHLQPSVGRHGGGLSLRGSF